MHSLSAIKIDTGNLP